MKYFGLCLSLFLLSMIFISSCGEDEIINVPEAPKWELQYSASEYLISVCFTDTNNGIAVGYYRGNYKNS